MVFTVSSIQKRFLLFLLGCIPTRLLLSYLAFVSNMNDIFRLILSGILVSISIGFITIYIFGLRKVGTETMGQKIWWNMLRPLHSVFYGLSGVILLFAIFGNKSNTISSLILLIDTIIGLLSFIVFHCVSLQ